MELQDQYALADSESWSSHRQETGNLEVCAIAQNSGGSNSLEEIHVHLLGWGTKEEREDIASNK